jgi:hypothetical protein
MFMITQKYNPAHETIRFTSFFLITDLLSTPTEDLLYWNAFRYLTNDHCRLINKASQAVLYAFYRSQKLVRWYVMLHAWILSPANTAETQSLTSTQFVYISLNEQSS